MGLKSVHWAGDDCNYLILKTILKYLWLRCKAFNPWNTHSPWDRAANFEYCKLYHLSTQQKGCQLLDGFFHFSFIDFSIKIFGFFYPLGPLWWCRRLCTWPKYSMLNGVGLIWIFSIETFRLVPLWNFL